MADGTRKRSGVVQIRTARADGWTKAARTTFLSYLAMTCNVDQACRQAGKCTAGLYRLRGRDPAFAAAWDAALEQGYGRVEAELLRCALGDVFQPDDLHGEDSHATGSHVDGATTGDRAPAAPFDPDLGLKLLAQRHGADAKGRRARVHLRQPTRAEVLSELDKRLTAMERRLTLPGPGEAA